jgi:uncharacterized membrane protein YqaE (UPF0057 family)
MVAGLSLIFIGVILPPFYYVRVKGYNKMGTWYFYSNLALILLGFIIGFNVLSTSMSKAMSDGSG